MDRAEPFKGDKEMVKRIDKALDDYREAVKQDYERPALMPLPYTCCLVHGPNNQG